MRRVGQDRREAVPLSVLQRHRAQREGRQRHDALVAQLRPGAAIVVRTYTQEMWWFVIDGDLPKRQVDAKTIMFDMPRAKTFSFDLVEPRPAISIDDEIEANGYRRRLGLAEWSEFAVDSEDDIDLAA